MSYPRSGSSRSSSSLGAVATRAPSRALETPPVPSSLVSEKAERRPSTAPAHSMDSTSSSSRVGLVETLAKQLQLAQEKLQHLEQTYDNSAAFPASSPSSSALATSTVTTRPMTAGTHSSYDGSERAPRHATWQPDHSQTAQHQRQEARTSAFLDRAQEALGDYEATVRDSEERSLRLLQERLETMEVQWRTRLAAFQDAKTSYETHIADMIQRALADRDGTLKETAEQLKNDFDAVVRDARKERATLEQQVLQQADEFRKQYKAILDEDYAERCQALETRLAEREKQWAALVQQERRNALEGSHVREETASTAHLDAMKQALADVGRLRDDLLASHEAQEKKLLEQYTQAAEESRAAHEAALRDCTERTQRVQRECAETLVQMHRKVESLQAQLTAKEAGMARADNAEQVAKTEKLFEHVSTVRKQVEAQWQSVVDGMREDYESRYQHLVQQQDQRVEKLRAEHVLREREALRTCEARVVAVEEAADARWAIRLAEVQRTSDRQLDAVQALRQANEELTAKLDGAVQSLETQALAHQTAMVALKQKQDGEWQGKLEQVRERYDALLQSALQEQQGSVSRAAYDQTLERLHAMEARAVHAQEEIGQHVREAISQTETLWSQRVREAEQRAAAYEVQLQERYSALRKQLYQTVSEHEKAFSEAAEAERKRLEKEFTERNQLEHDRSEARQEEAMATLKAVYEARVQERHDELQQQEELLRARELALTERERSVEDIVRSKTQHVIRAASASLQEELDDRWDALRDAQADLDAQRGLIRAELVAEYEGRLTAIKRQWEHDVAQTMHDSLQHSEARFALWQQCRAEEQDMLHSFYQKALQLQQAQQQRWGQDVQEQSHQFITAMEARGVAHDAQLLSEWSRFQQTLMEAAEAKAEKLTAQQSASMQSIAAESAEQVSARWQQLEERLVGESRDATARSASLETALKHKYDTLLQEERQRTAASLEKAKREAREELQAARQDWARATREQIKQVTAEVEQVQQRRDAQQRDVEAAHAKHLAELRGHYDQLLARQRQQSEAREEELASSFDRLQRQSLEAAGQQAEHTREAYEKKLEAAAERETRQREEHARALAHAEAAASAKHASLVSNLEQSYKQSLAMLEAALTRKTQELAAAEAATQRRVAEQVRALEATMESQYAAFVESERRLREDEEAATDARLAKRTAEAAEAAKREAVAAMEETLAAERARRAEAETALAELRLDAERNGRVGHPLSRPPAAALQTLSTNTYLAGGTGGRLGASAMKPASMLTIVRQPSPSSSLPSPISSHAAARACDSDGVSVSQWNRLRQLWEVCMVAEDEVEAFVERVERLPLASAQASEVEAEMRRLEARLPLMELVAQRELVRQRLDGEHGAEEASIGQQQHQQAELTRLTQALLKELPAFETRHGQLFKVRGDRLLDTLLADEAF